MSIVKIPRPLRFGDRGYLEFIAGIYYGHEALPKFSPNPLRIPYTSEFSTIDDRLISNAYYGLKSSRTIARITELYDSYDSFNGHKDFDPDPDYDPGHHRSTIESLCRHHYCQYCRNNGQAIFAMPAYNKCRSIGTEIKKQSDDLVSRLEQEFDNSKESDGKCREFSWHEKINNHDDTFETGGYSQFRRILEKSSFCHSKVLTKMRNVDKQEKTYQCDNLKCEKKFSRKEELARHKRTHNKERRYQCEICQRTFGRKDHRKKHMFTHDDIADRRRYMCTEGDCGKRYTRSDALSRHRNKAHPSHGN